MLKTWLIYHRGRWAELPAALERLEAAMAQAALTPEEVNDHHQRWWLVVLHLEGATSLFRVVP